MSTAARPVTAEELLRMSHDGVRRELVKGELRTMAPAGFDHGAVIDNVQFLLSRHVREHKLGVVVGAETGFKLSIDPDTVRGADVAFVSAERLAGRERPRGFWPGAPDLAVEVVSPTDTVDEIEEKVDDYLRAGARLVWVVNPRRRTVTVYRPGAQPVLLTEDQELTGEDVVPGFRCHVREFFL
jgi:Uma2 family endonuclease